MTNCPICNRETDFVSNWCDDCLTEWLDFSQYQTVEIAQWAANRAREFHNKETDNV